MYKIYILRDGTGKKRSASGAFLRKGFMARSSITPVTRRPSVRIREMEIDDIAPVFHLGEILFKADETPTMYRTWDPFEVTTLFNSDTEFCLVAEDEDTLVGFALGTTITKNHSAWKYGYLIWLGVCREYQRGKVAEKLCIKRKSFCEIFMPFAA